MWLNSPTCYTRGDTAGVPPGGRGGGEGQFVGGERAPHRRQWDRALREERAQIGCWRCNESMTRGSGEDLG